MDALFVAILLLFAVFGVICLAESILDGFFEKNRVGDKIIIYVKTNEERLEGLVRHLIAKNPYAKIIVSDEEKSAEIEKIVDNLAKEYAEVYIGKSE